MAVTHITKENFENEIKQSDSPVIIDFWASWCGPCHMMGPVFEELSEEFDNVKFAKLNVDENMELASGFGIQGIPALIVTKNGEEVDRIVGFAPKDSLREKIKAITDKIN
mgnify:CR=1 FL=1